MAYSALTFTASEVPTLTKWNQLWANDASMNDGTGIANNAILNRHVAANNLLASKLSNPYKFSVYRVAVLTVVSSALVPMDNKSFDTGNNYSTATGLFTTPVAGFYYFAGQITNSGTPSYSWADLLVNNISVRRGNRNSSSNTNGIQVAVSGLLLLAVGDTVGIGVTNGISSALEVADKLKCYFDGFLVSSI